MSHLYKYLCWLLLAATLYADGVMVPGAANYPYELLRPRVTRLTVETHGPVMETRVYQEFVNEWDQKTDAVYNYPLPFDARATLFVYWYGDQVYQAVLQVKEQSVNPGTGEGGMAALVNAYIGKNGIKVMLKDIQPHTLQKVELRYIQTATVQQDGLTFSIPMKTDPFVQYPLDLFEADFYVYNQPEVRDFATNHYGTCQNAAPCGNFLHYRQELSKTYLANDLKLTYKVPHDTLQTSFFCTKPEGDDGYFSLTIDPPDNADGAAQCLPKRLVFVLENSTRVSQENFNLCRTAIKECLSRLNPADSFNIVLFNYNYQYWQSTLKCADSANITQASAYLDGVSRYSGVSLESAMQFALNQFKDILRSNMVLLITSGYAYFNLNAIQNSNKAQAAIFTVGVGDDPDYYKIQAISAYNHGFASFFRNSDEIYSGIRSVFDRINQPLLRQVLYEMGGGTEIYDLLPEIKPDLYAGSSMLLVGRYRQTGSASLSIAGNDSNGALQGYGATVTMETGNEQNQFVEKLWAREKIDDLERRIAVWGETDSLKTALIELSLKHNIRCKYTAYVADYTTPLATDENPDMPKGPGHFALIKNYPNPFNAGTTIYLYLGEETRSAAPKELIIRDLMGRTVERIDLSAYAPGYHALRFNAAHLPTGIYFCQLRVGSQSRILKLQLIR